MQCKWLVLPLAMLALASCAEQPAEAKPQRADRRAQVRSEAPAAPLAGEAAPDFTLNYLGSDETATLSDYAGESPVVLIFGSYT